MQEIIFTGWVGEALKKLWHLSNHGFLLEGILKLDF